MFCKDTPEPSKVSPGCFSVVVESVRPQHQLYTYCPQHSKQYEQPPPLPQPGYLLICSDGLWGVVANDVLGKMIISANSPHQACQDMVNAANEAGGPDNITVILVRLPD